jgi:hypothetical protein
MEKETRVRLTNAEEDPYELDQTDRAILKHLVDYPLIKNTELGKKVGLSANTISKRRKKPAFIKAFADLQSTTDDLLERAQKMAARRLLTFIKDPDKKFALDAMKVALSQRAQKKEVEVKENIVFQTKVGSQGQLMQEVLVVKNNHTEDTSPKQIIEAQDESEDEQNDNVDKS